MIREELQQAIQEHFDEGRELTPEIEEQLAVFPDLCAQWDRLTALDRALVEVPLEEPAPDLTQRVQAHVARARAQTKRTVAMSIRLAASVALMVAATVAGWFYSDWASPLTWWARIEPWLPYGQWPEPGPSVLPELSETVTAYAARVAEATQFSTLTIGLMLGGAAAALAIFNGFGALTMRKYIDATR